MSKISIMKEFWAFLKSPQKMVVSADHYFPSPPGCINYLYTRFCISPFYLYIILDKIGLGVIYGYRRNKKYQEWKK